MAEHSDPESTSAPLPLVPDTWTVKEVVADLKADLIEHLNKQDGVLTEIDRKVDSKADKADLTALGAKFDNHGNRITSLEEHRANDLASKRFRTRVWAVVGSVAGTSAVIVAALISARVIR